MGLSLADVLTDFGKPDLAAPLPAAGLDFDFPQQPFEMPEPEPEPEPGPDVEAMIAEAVAAAEAALAARLEAEASEALAAERERHAEEIASLQASLGEHAGEALLARIAELEERLVDLTASVTARILGPVLSADLQKRAIADLGRVIREALREPGAVRIRVRGPMSLVEALRQALGEAAARVEFAEADGLDLTVAVEDSLFETRLAEWSASISEVLE